MFWWVIGLSVAITAFGGWRIFRQARVESGNMHTGLRENNSAALAEVPETLESLLLKRMERQLSGMEEKLEVMMAITAGLNLSGAGTPLTAAVKERDKPVADQYQTQLDQIVRLSERGTALEDIAKKMKMHKGEVQLLLNLSKKSS